MKIRERSISLTDFFAVAFLLFVSCLCAPDFDAYAQGQSKPNFCGSGTSTCSCTEQLISANDNEEIVPPDSDPKGEDGMEYELVPASSAEVNGKNAGSLVIVEGWSKSPDEILADAISLLNPGQKRMYEHLRSGGTSPAWLPWADLVQFQSSRKLQGPFEYLTPSESDSTNLITSRYMVLKWGPKNCFFRLEDGASKPQMRLDFCISNTWRNGDPRQQLYYYLTTYDKSIQAGVLDFVVGFTPFLGSADLIFNQETIQKAMRGELDAAADLTGSVAGDLFVLAKALKLTNLFKGSKIVQGVAISSGASSVIFTGGYLWSNSDWGGAEYGRAAFMGVEIALMLLDKDARQFIAQYSKREFFKRKKPAGAPLACAQVCDSPNTRLAKIEPATAPAPAIKAISACNAKIPRKTRLVGQILDGIPPPTYEDMLIDLPDQIIRRVGDDWGEKTRPKGKNSQEMVSKSNISEGYINPAAPDGGLEPWRHIKGKQGELSPWLSFSDSRIGEDLAEGAEAFGKYKITFHVKRYLEEARKLGLPAEQVIILSHASLGKYLSGRLDNFLKDCLRINPKAKITPETISELYKLMGSLLKNTSEEGYTKVLTYLQNNMGLSKTKATSMMDDYCKPWMHYKRNGEVLVLGQIPWDNRFVDSEIIANFETK